ncbi:MAG: hypothetical protein IT462_13870 [Planctomycetes bacterium]|nr:hypothetical protein [Planctomycetota bacterium]
MKKAKPAAKKKPAKPAKGAAPAKAKKGLSERAKAKAKKVAAEVKAIKEELAEIAPVGRNRLSHADSAPLLQRVYVGALTTGLLQPLISFANSIRNLAGIAARTWHDAMMGGKTPEEAMRKMEPGLPAKVEELLAIGMKNGTLDYVLADVLDVYATVIADDARDEAFKALLTRYKSAKPTTVACAGCVARELDKIWRRAATENATDVVIQQDGDRFMIQTYASVKAVRISEASGSYVFNALKATLGKAATTDKPLPLDDSEIACRGGNGQFALSAGNRRLAVTFR